jgi:hypothetical protein
LHSARVILRQVVGERMLRFPNRVLRRFAHGYQKVVLVHAPPSAPRIQYRQFSIRNWVSAILVIGISRIKRLCSKKWTQ